MTWQAWGGAVVLYGLAAVVIGCLALIGWAKWRDRLCHDSIRNTGARCVLPSGHDGAHRAAHGTTWRRMGVKR